MRQQDSATFHFISARDTSSTWCIWGVVFLLLALSVTIPVRYQWIYTLLALIACVFSLSFLYRTRYELQPQVLRAFCGLFCKTLPYLCNNRRPSYALAAQRVQIIYQTKKGETRTLYVSPVDCDGFLILLQAACPHLQGLAQ